MPVNVTTGGASFPADAMTIRRDDGESGLGGSLIWHGGPYPLSRIGRTLTVDAASGGPWPGVDGSPGPSADLQAGIVFRRNRDPRGSLSAQWRRISGDANRRRVERILAILDGGRFFDRWSGNPWWAYLDGFGRAIAPDSHGVYHLLTSRLGPDTQYSAAISTLRRFGIGVREGSGGLELIDLLRPDGPVDLPAGLIRGLPAEGDDTVPYNFAGGYVTRDILVPFVVPQSALSALYLGGPSVSSSAPPLFVRESGRSREKARAEELLQRNLLRLSATRITVEMGCGWWGIQPGSGFRLPAALDPEARVWRTESVAMSMSGSELSTTLQGRLHQPDDFWTGSSGGGDVL